MTSCLFLLSCELVAKTMLKDSGPFEGLRIWKCLSVEYAVLGQ